MMLGIQNSMSRHVCIPKFQLKYLEAKSLNLVCKTFKNSLDKTHLKISLKKDCRKKNVLRNEVIYTSVLDFRAN